MKSLQIAKTHRIKIVILAFLLNYVGQFGIDVYLPSMPNMQHAFNTNSAHIKLTIGVYLIGMGFGQFIFGFLADRFGRRASLMTGAIGFSAMSFILLFSHTIVSFLVWRFLQGFFVTAGMVVGRVVSRDLFESKQLMKISSYLTALWAMIPVFAPMIGGYIQEYLGWHMNFIVIFVLSLIVTTMIYLLFPETKPSNDEHPYDNFYQGLRHVLRNKLFVFCLLNASFGSAYIFAYNAISAFLLQVNLHLLPSTFGWIAFSMASFILLGSFSNAQLLNHFSRKRLIYTSYGFITVASIVLLTLALTASLSILTVAIPVAIVFFASMLNYPNFSGSSYGSLNKYRGIGTAVYGTVQLAVCGLLTVFTVLLPTHSATGLAILFLIFVAIQALLVIPIRKQL
tara:strand:+ start:54584 stop:55774 length:1191 start_codon:yes stop_codon:yes gene_type:complete